jgi:phage-related protein
MIIFNGVAMPDVAKVEDVQPSAIPRTPQARQRPIRFGADYVRMGGGQRTVTITFSVLTNDPDMRQMHIDLVNTWAHSDGEGKLELPGHPGRYLQCICTQYASASVWKWWEKGLTLVFTCFDNPFWTDIVEKSAPCGTEFIALGTAHDGPLMQIRRTLTDPAQDQTYSNGAESMTFANIPAGELVIDLNRQTAAVDGVSIMQHYAFDSQFLLPQNGKQTITGTGTVYWRERWD